MTEKEKFLQDLIDNLRAEEYFNWFVYDEHELAAVIVHMFDQRFN